MPGHRITVLFPGDPARPRDVDPDYAAEADAAARAGFQTATLDLDALTAGRPTRAVRFVDNAAPGTAFYRGWMIASALYATLHGELADRGLHLVSTPAQYATCHELPGWYGALEGETPRSVWFPTRPSEYPADEQLAAALRPFGDGPIIVKDYVKSRKHEWAEACFVPSAADFTAARRVVRRLVDLQGDDLTGGVVLREFVPFRTIGRHAASASPLVHEFRAFVLDGHPLLVTRYWDQGDYEAAEPTEPYLEGIAARVASRFFTVDVALTETGRWLVVELGDAQVAGLPDHVNPAEFYQGLHTRLAAAPAPPFPT